MFWLLRLVGNDGFWQIVDGPFPNMDAAYKKMDEWRRSSPNPASYNILNMVVMK